MHHRRKISIALILSFLGLSLSTAHAVRRDDLPSITVLADSSLILPLTQIARDYAREAKVSVSLSFASAIEQLEEIEEGTPANVLITAQPGWLERLKAQGLADVYSQKSIASNQLVLVARTDHPTDFTFAGEKNLSTELENYGKYYYFIAADPTFLEMGAYSTEVISYYKWDMDLEAHFVFPNDLPSMHKLIAEKPHAGLLYLSEAKRNPRLRVIDTVPQEAYTPIHYEAIVVAGEHMNQARDFIAYLQSVPAQLRLSQLGFTPAEQD